MTASMFLSSITDAISSASISGVTVKDADQLAYTWQSQANILYPNPNPPGFMSGFSMNFDSVMQGADAPMTLIYTLNYRFLGTALGDAASFTNAYSGVVSKLILIINAFLALPAPYSGRVQLSIGAVDIGAKTDPAGNQYHGADIQLNIEEMQN